jgi:hypothetical protein
MDRIPRITSATAVGPVQLLVAFEDGSERVYDCGPLLERPYYELLKNPAFFRAVRVDVGGCGISWNDDLDLSEYELWTNGKPVSNESHPRAAVGHTSRIGRPGQG